MKKYIFSAVAILLLSACSKDDEAVTPTPVIPVAQDERPMSKFIYALGFDTNWQHTSNFNSHVGCAFQPTANGKITHLAVRVPTLQTGKDAIVRLWDATTQTLLVSEEIDVPEASKGFTYEVPIAPIVIDATHEYVITKSSVYLYNHFNGDHTDGNYPATVGSFIFLHSVSETGDGFPDDYTSVDRYIGDVGFVFKKN